MPQPDHVWYIPVLGENQKWRFQNCTCKSKIVLVLIADRCKITSGCTLYTMPQRKMKNITTEIRFFFKKALTIPAATPVAAADYWGKWLYVIFHKLRILWGSLLSPVTVTPQYFLSFAATQTHFQALKTYICIHVTYLWSEKIKPKYVLFLKKYENSLKCQLKCQWQQVITGAAYVAPWLFATFILRCRRSVWTNAHVLLAWNFVILEFLILSPSMVLLLFPAMSCQSSRVGVFLTAFSLGFILLMKFEFLFLP